MTTINPPRKKRFHLTKYSQALIEDVRATGDVTNPLTGRVTHATLDDAVLSMYRAWQGRSQGAKAYNSDAFAKDWGSDADAVYDSETGAEKTTLSEAQRPKGSPK